MNIYVERQADGSYAAFNDAGLIVSAETQTAAASLARAANPGSHIRVGPQRPSDGADKIGMLGEARSRASFPGGVCFMAVLALQKILPH